MHVIEIFATTVFGPTITQSSVLEFVQYQQLSSMKYNTIDSFMRVVIIYFLVPIMGLKGYKIMLYAGTIFNALLSINRLIMVSHVRFRMYEWVVMPIFAITAAGIFARVILKCPIIISILAVVILYVLVLRAFKCITKTDILWLKRVFMR